MMRGSIYVSDSGNTKIMGSKKVDATYSSIKHTCPTTCALKNEGCYAQSSYVGMTNARNERRAKGSSALDVARAEVKVIDTSYGGGDVPSARALRLHVAGDSRTVKGTQLLGSAIKRWQARGGGDCWSYTHAWRNVARKHWKTVSVLASVDSVNDVDAARKQGYAPALVVPHFEGEKAFTLPGSDVKWIPCVAQTRQVGCSDCRLCFNADRLFEGKFGIAFAAHGVKKESLKRHLTIIK